MVQAGPKLTQIEHEYRARHLQASRLAEIGLPPAIPRLWEPSARPHRVADGQGARRVASQVVADAPGLLAVSVSGGPTDARRLPGHAARAISGLIMLAIAVASASCGETSSQRSAAFAPVGTVAIGAGFEHTGAGAWRRRDGEQIVLLFVEPPQALAVPPGTVLAAGQVPVELTMVIGT